MDNLVYHVWLTLLMGADNKKTDLLLARFNSAKEVYALSQDDLRYSEYLSSSDIDILFKNRDLSDALNVIEECKRLGIKIVASYMLDYPKRLENIYSPPHILYVGGNIDNLDKELCISIVGTRNCSQYGKKVAYNLGYNLAKSGCIVISGIARGIDTAAISGAVDAGGKTIAVLGNGVNIAYPPENAELIRKVAKNGGVVSEYPPSTAVQKNHFPKRNRIISGLGLGVVIVEAPLKSGALITASYALEQGRDVFVVPGNIDDINSEGSNSLIREGARLVRNAQDILFEYKYFMPSKIIETDEAIDLEVLNSNSKLNANETQSKVVESLNKEFDFSLLSEEEEKKIARLLYVRDMTLQEILSASDLSSSKINSTLTIMEVNGIIEKKLNRQYKLVL